MVAAAVARVEVATVAAVGRVSATVAEMAKAIAVAAETTGLA